MKLSALVITLVLFCGCNNKPSMVGMPVKIIGTPIVGIVSADPWSANNGYPEYVITYSDTTGKVHNDRVNPSLVKFISEGGN